MGENAACSGMLDRTTTGGNVLEELFLDIKRSCLLPCVLLFVPQRALENPRSRVSKTSRPAAKTFPLVSR